MPPLHWVGGRSLPIRLHNNQAKLSLLSPLGPGWPAKYHWHPGRRQRIPHLAHNCQACCAGLRLGQSFYVPAILSDPSTGWGPVVWTVVPGLDGILPHLRVGLCFRVERDAEGTLSWSPAAPPSPIPQCEPFDVRKHMAWVWGVNVADLAGDPHHQSGPPLSPAPIPPRLDTPEFRSTWSQWLSYREQKRQPVSPAAARMQLADLDRYGVAAAIAAIRLSIANDWKGLFPEKPRSNTSRRGYQSHDERVMSQVLEAMAFAQAATNPLALPEGGAK